MELGNKTSLEYVARMLKEKVIIREIFDIDSSDNYDDLKNKAYINLSDKIDQEIEILYVNLYEMNIYVAEESALNMKFNENPQMSTAKGLWLVGKQKFN